MAITPEQLVAITTKLSVSLSALADDKLIELCLLYRSAPEAKPTFPTLLETEITRRFTAAEIASNDVMFSVINNFNNQFNPELQYKEKMYEFVNALDRELWITQNITFFEQLLEITERINWVLNDNVVMTAVAGSTTAMASLLNSNNASSALIGSSVAMPIAAGSSVAMGLISGSSTILTKILVSSLARNALMNNNPTFQSYREQIYNTVKINWTKQSTVWGNTNAINAEVPKIRAAIVNPTGFVFATLGSSVTSPDTRGSLLRHPNNSLAREVVAGLAYVVTVTLIDAVSFNGAYAYTLSGGNGQVAAELWIPPA